MTSNTSFFQIEDTQEFKLLSADSKKFILKLCYSKMPLMDDVEIIEEGSTEIDWRG